MVKLFYLKIAEKLSIDDENRVRQKILDLILKTLSEVPIFMQEKISAYVEIHDGNPILDSLIPLCRSCKYLKRWNSEAPFCAVTSSSIKDFVERCNFYSAVVTDPEYVDEVKFNMDESYNDSDDY
jgi:hypothetical protein